MIKLYNNRSGSGALGLRLRRRRLGALASALARRISARASGGMPLKGQSKFFRARLAEAQLRVAGLGFPATQVQPASLSV